MSSKDAEPGTTNAKAPRGAEDKSSLVEKKEEDEEDE